jgi:hypothetical protein
VARQKGPLLFENQDGDIVGIPRAGTGPLKAVTNRAAVAVARMPGPGGHGPVINETGRCLTLVGPMNIRWAGCNHGANNQTWTRHAGGLQGSAPFAGLIDIDPRLGQGTLHVVRGEHGARLITDGFVPAND